MSSRDDSIDSPWDADAILMFERVLLTLARMDAMPKKSKEGFGPKRRFSSFRLCREFRRLVLQFEIKERPSFAAVALGYLPDERVVNFYGGIRDGVFVTGHCEEGGIWTFQCLASLPSPDADDGFRDIVAYLPGEAINDVRGKVISEELAFRLISAIGRHASGIVPPPASTPFRTAP